MSEKPIQRLIAPVEPPPAYTPPPAPAPNLVRVDGEGWVRIDGILIGRKVERNGQIMLQVCDKDHRRSSERGSRFLEVPLTDLVEALRRGEADFLSSFTPNQ
jgi:hypothetical protein